MKPRVSVIIPAWNRGALLAEAVQSVLNQTEQSLEVLVCDDGSTDNSREIIEKIKDSRLRWLPGIRVGRPAPARNRGIREAKGEWLAFLDSDDQWYPEKLEIQLQTAQSSRLKAVSSNAASFDPLENKITGALIDFQKDRISLSDLVSCNSVICSSMLIHHSIFASVQGFPEDHSFCAIEDYALWLRVASLTDIAYVPKQLVRYRDDAATSLRGENQMRDAVLKQRVFFDYLRWSLSTKNIPNLTTFFRTVGIWLWANFRSIASR